MLNKALVIEAGEPWNELANLSDMIARDVMESLNWSLDNNKGLSLAYRWIMKDILDSEIRRPML